MPLNPQNKPNVNFTREEVIQVAPQWGLIRDCLDGETKVKQRGELYLPRPNAADQTPENMARYRGYKDRAVFYNVTKRTLAGLTGTVFNRDPEILLPPELEVLEDDATGSGVDLEQLSKQACNLVEAYGRSGIWTDYPSTDGPSTQQQIESENLRPMLNVYDPWDIINWRTITRGSKVLLSLVVLREKYPIYDDGFETKMAYQWRVLELINGEYAVSLYKADSAIMEKEYAVPVMKAPNATYSLVEGPFYPTDAKGNKFDEIPFTFIGSEDNEPSVDAPPLYDMASLNIGHYRNSADYEEACFICGQPTPVFTGLTEDWVNGVLKGTVHLGSRAAIPLPVGATAELLQATENSMPKEAMEHKERQMVAIGAKLVESKDVQRTATEANIENASETSTLSNIAKNVSAAFRFALNKAALYAGVELTDENFKFSLHAEFDLVHLSEGERRQLVSEWVAGALSWTELRSALKKAGVATQDDKDAKAEIDADQEKEIANAAAMAEASGNAAPGSEPADE